MPDDRLDSQTIQVSPLTPTIGAELFGVDLSQPLGERQFDEIHGALMRHLVIFFRDQHLTIEQHKAFGRRFGALDIHPTSRMEGHPEIIEIKADENSKYVAGEVWHSDVTCNPIPPMGSILYLHKIPDNGGGDTLFINMYRAYETLSAPVRNLIDGLTAVHDGDRVYRLRQRKNVTGDLPRAEHPVVRTHPVTGRKALFVNPNFTSPLASGYESTRPQSSAMPSCFKSLVARSSSQIARGIWKTAERASPAFWSSTTSVITPSTSSSARASATRS